MGTDRDFPEDAVQDPDNGAYRNTCYRCGWSFTGNKRRVFCKDCQRQHEQACRERKAGEGGA